MKRKRDSIASSRSRARANQKCKGVKREDDEPESQELCPFANLPAPIITNHIMLPLPIKSLVSCRLVCKTWNALISDPHFARLYLQRAQPGLLIRTNDRDRVSRNLHLLELERVEGNHNNRVKLEPVSKLPLTDALLTLETRHQRLRRRRTTGEYCKFGKFGVVNSSNGLLCLQSEFDETDLVVCNPITGEFITLPKPDKAGKTFDVSVGFGFYSKNNEYKVVRIWKGNDRPKIVVQIYTLGKPTWRNVDVDNQFVTEINRLTFPTCVNDALHWITFDGWQMSILCFDFESEKFQSFPSPTCVLKHNRVEFISMAEFGGFLYLCVAYSRKSCKIRVMKNCGVGGSWTTVFRIGGLPKPQLPYGLCMPVKQVQNGVAILMQYSSNCFVYCEPEKNGYKLYRVIGTQAELFEVIPHTPTLVSLKDVVNGDNIEVLNVHSRCAKFKLEEDDEVLFLTGDN